MTGRSLIIIPALILMALCLACGGGESPSPVSPSPGALYEGDAAPPATDLADEAAEAAEEAQEEAESAAGEVAEEAQEEAESAAGEVADEALQLQEALETEPTTAPTE